MCMGHTKTEKKMSNFMKIRQVVLELLHADRQDDASKSTSKRVRNRTERVGSSPSPSYAVLRTLS
jgi:hypothetical protein